MRPQQGTGIGGWVVLGLVVASFVVCGVVLKPERALTIASGAALATALDGFAEEPGAHRLPIIDIRVGEGTAIGEGPGHAVAARVISDGVSYDARIHFTDSLTRMAKRSMHIAFTVPPARFPFQRVDLLGPATPDMLQPHMALWVAGEMGVPVAASVLVQLRLNGHDIGVMELRERVSADVERVRGLSPLDGIVGPVTAAGAWPEEWPASAGAAVQRAKVLSAVLADTLITAYARRDSIAAIVDVDALLRMAATLDVLNTRSAQCAWVFSAQDGIFQPVLCASGFMDAPEVDSTRVPDPNGLLERVLAEPEWRARRDQLAREARKRFADEGMFAKRWSEEEQALMPSLLRDRTKHAPIATAGPGSFSYSVYHAAKASAQARAAAQRHWSATEGQP
jgi:hypothetical protein